MHKPLALALLALGIAGGGAFGQDLSAAGLAKLSARNPFFPQAAHPRPRSSDELPPGFTFLNYPGASSTGAFGINLGEKKDSAHYAVGAYGPNLPTSDGTGTGFLLQLGTTGDTISESYQRVLPNIPNLAAYGVNDSRQIVGGFLPDLNNLSSSHGFLLAEGKFTQLDVPDVSFAGSVGVTWAQDINNSGLVIGYWQTLVNGQYLVHGFTWSQGVYTNLPDYPNSISSFPWTVNSKGDMAGQWTDANSITHGFVLKNGVYTTFDAPGALSTAGLGINDSDVVLGGYCATTACLDTGVGEQWFTYSNGAFTYIPLPWLSAATPSTIWLSGINDAGSIVGNFLDQAGLEHSFLINP
jgi:hypothetical protein